MEVLAAGPPEPKPRMTRRDKWLFPRRACVDRYLAWKDTVMLAAALTARKYEGLPHAGPVMLDINFYFEPEGKESVLHVAKPDLDNLVKAVMEALTGVIYEDDRQVAVLGATKIKLSEKESEKKVGAKILIRLVTP